MILDNLHIDNYLKFEHSENSNSTADDNTLIGATTSEDRTLDFTPDDTNSVYVSKAGNDTTGDGTAANPFLTIKHAMTAVTATKCNIVIADSGTYVEESMVVNTDCGSIVSAIGCTPTIKPEILNKSGDYIVETSTEPLLISSTNSNSGCSSRIATLSNGNFVIMYIQWVSNNGYVYFKIVDIDGTSVVDETLAFSVLNTSIPYFGDVVALDTGYFAITFTGRTYIYTNSGIVIASYTGSSFKNSSISTVGGYDNRLVVAGYVSDAGMYYYIISHDNTSITEITSTTLLVAGRAEENGKISLLPRPDGGFIVSYKVNDSNSNLWIVVDNNGTILNNSAVIANTTWCSGYIEEDENTIIFACSDASNNLHLIKYSLDDYSVIKADTNIVTITDATNPIITKINHGNYAIIAGLNTGYVCCVNEAWTLIWSESISTGKFFNLAYNNTANKLSITYTSTSSPYGKYLYIKGSFKSDWWTISSTINFNGIKLCPDAYCINKYISVSSGCLSLSFKWCDIYDVHREPYYNETYPVKYIISSAINHSIENSKIYDCYYGFDLTSNAVTANNNLIYGISYSPAFKITGSGANIIFNHNTAFNNQIGLELVSNAGTEIIKNSIFGNNQTAVKAETSVLIKNCCIPDPLDNATYDATSSTLNPLFISDGYVTAIDLHLQSKVLGYAFDSPALGIADDSKDAGCYDVTYTLNPASYTSFIIPKPKTIIPDITTVNKIVNVMQDGSVDIQVDAYQLEIELNWDSIRKRYIKDIIKLFMAEGDIRIYFNPATYPTIYEEMKLVTKELPLNSDIYTLTDSGFNKFKLEFVRKFQLSELVD